MTKIEAKAYSFKEAKFVKPDQMLFGKSDTKGYLHFTITGERKFMLYRSTADLTVTEITPAFSVNELVEFIMRAYEEGKDKLAKFLLLHLAEEYENLCG